MPTWRNVWQAEQKALELSATDTQCVGWLFKDCKNNCRQTGKWASKTSWGMVLYILILGLICLLAYELVWFDSIRFEFKFKFKLTGYGHSTPKTTSGMVFTMFYASFGIPLGLVMFNSIGKSLFPYSLICEWVKFCLCFILKDRTEKSIAVKLWRWETEQILINGDWLCQKISKCQTGANHRGEFLLLLQIITRTKITNQVKIE